MISLIDYLTSMIRLVIKLRLKATDADTLTALREVDSWLSDLLDAAVGRQLDETTDDYKDAIAGLKTAKKSLDAAVKDIAKVQQAIDKATTAATVVDRLLKAGLTIM